MYWQDILVSHKQNISNQRIYSRPNITVPSSVLFAATVKDNRYPLLCCQQAILFMTSTLLISQNSNELLLCRETRTLFLRASMCFFLCFCMCYHIIICKKPFILSSIALKNTPRRIKQTKNNVTISSRHHKAEGHKARRRLPRLWQWYAQYCKQ